MVFVFDPVYDINLMLRHILQPPANTVYMTDAPPPYPGINGTNGYRQTIHQLWSYLSSLASVMELLVVVELEVGLLLMPM